MGWAKDVAAFLALVLAMKILDAVAKMVVELFLAGARDLAKIGTAAKDKAAKAIALEDEGVTKMLDRSRRS